MPQDTQMRRIITSNNGQIIFCGQLMIQMSENFKKVNDIGCIIKTQQNMQNEYHIHSLLDLEDRSVISKAAKNNIDNIVHFSFS